MHRRGKCAVWGLLAFIACSALSWSTPGGPRTARASEPDVAAQAEEASLRAVAALFYRDAIVCTGTLVAPRALLTARHCVGADSVRFGGDVLAPDLTLRVVDHAVPREAIDAALLYLDRPAQGIVPVALRAAGASEAPRELLVAGYGNHRGRRPGARHTFRARAHDWACGYDNYLIRGCVPAYEMVLPRSHGADTCQGDSGGPVFETQGGTVRQVAVTSRAVRDSILQCGDGGIYIRVDAIANWIARASRGGE